MEKEIGSSSFTLQAQEEQWKETYRKNRYLQHCNQVELAERMDDIWGNCCLFAPDGTTRVAAPLEKNRWMRLLADVMFEVECRRLPSVAFKLRNFHLDHSKYPNVIKASSLWSKLGLQHGQCIYKFGQLKYQRDLFEKGLLKISNASSYKEAFIPAIKDDELAFSQLIVGGRTVITDKEGIDHDMETIGPCVITHSTPTDYYISSYAVLFENRLFDDFSADSCLFIKDVNEFENRLRTAMEKAFPNSICAVGGVKYCDPYFSESELEVYFVKHFRYQYQRELRFVWIPEVPQESLKPLFIELGCLSDICELVIL